MTHDLLHAGTPAGPTPGGAPQAAGFSMPERVTLLGSPVDVLTLPDLNAFVTRAVTARERSIIANVNMHSLALHQRDAKMREFYTRASIVHVDGMPVIALARFLGLPLRRQHRTTYLDWIGPLLRLAATEEWRVFYLGSRPGVAATAAARLAHDLPALRLATAHGYFDTASHGPENEHVLDMINAYRPDVLLVGMGMPRQEHWILANVDRLDAAAILPCGGCMDYIAGVSRTPPRWSGRMGVEWLFRLGSEPGRLWRRYLLEPWQLLPPLLREVSRLRLEPPADSNGSTEGKQPDVRPLHRDAP